MPKYVGPAFAVLFTLFVAAGGFAFTSQVSALSEVSKDLKETKTTVAAQGERISRLEAIIEIQIEINRRLADRALAR